MNTTIELVKHLKSETVLNRLDLNNHSIEIAIETMNFDNLDFQPVATEAGFAPIFGGQQSISLLFKLPIAVFNRATLFFALEIINWLAQRKNTPINPDTGKHGFATAATIQETMVWQKMQFLLTSEFEFELANAGPTYDKQKWALKNDS